MGQKVDPRIQRIGIINTWNSKWYADKKHFADLFLRDIEVRKAIHANLVDAGISKIEIERSEKKVTVNIYSSKPGIIIGRQGIAIEELKDKLHKEFKEVFEVNIREVKNPELSAEITADAIAKQIEKRGSYRRAAKMAITKAIEAGAKGIKIFCAGRLNGVEIARSEFFKDGNIPLHTFRADIDYAKATAFTTYGAIGIKVWIYKGEVFKKKNVQTLQA